MNQHWMAVWGCPIARPGKQTCEWMKDVTARMELVMTVSGSALRFHFSNLFGEDEVSIRRATVSVAENRREIDLARLAEITFGGKEQGVMAPQGELCSDEIPFAFQAGEKLTVNLYFEDFTHVQTAHQNGGALLAKWHCQGDHTHNVALPLADYSDLPFYPFLHTVDALCDENCYSIVAYGDSITAQSWPDRLNQRLLAEGVTNTTVIRKAISGSRVLREYPCASYYGYGPKGLDRFEREVVRAGVKKVIILHGVNDLIHPMYEPNPWRPITDLPTAQELIAGLQFYVDVAHANGIEAYLAPILPFQGWHSYEQRREDIRQEVNRWIREDSNADGVIDFDKALADDRDPNCLSAPYDSGDHLHPSGNGAQTMAECIPLSFFE